MSAEPLHIFDARRNIHVQCFSGRAATTTLHDASATGVSISGIFQAAEDFAVLCLHNAYDYLNHLRLKQPPGTDLFVNRRERIRRIASTSPVWTPNVSGKKLCLISSIPTMNSAWDSGSPFPSYVVCGASGTWMTARLWGRFLDS